MKEGRRKKASNLDRDQHLKQGRRTANPTRALPGAEERETDFAFGVEVRVESVRSSVGRHRLDFRRHLVVAESFEEDRKCNTLANRSPGFEGVKGRGKREREKRAHSAGRKMSKT
jgi:hypothetical protein